MRQYAQLALATLMLVAVPATAVQIHAAPFLEHSSICGGTTHFECVVTNDSDVTGFHDYKRVSVDATDPTSPAVVFWSAHFSCRTLP